MFQLTHFSSKISMVALLPPKALITSKDREGMNVHINITVRFPHCDCKQCRQCMNGSRWSTVCKWNWAVGVSLWWHWEESTQHNLFLCYSGKQTGKGHTCCIQRWSSFWSEISPTVLQSMEDPAIGRKSFGIFTRKFFGIGIIKLIWKKMPSFWQETLKQPS